MKTIVTSTPNFTRKHMIAVGSGSVSVKEYPDNAEIHVNAVAVVKDDRDPESIKHIAAFVCTDGTIVTSISTNILDIIPDVIEIMEEEPEVTLRIMRRTSRQGREFFSAIVL